MMVDCWVILDFVSTLEWFFEQPDKLPSHVDDSGICILASMNQGGVGESIWKKVLKFESYQWVGQPHQIVFLTDCIVWDIWEGKFDRSLRWSQRDVISEISTIENA
jgi:hypothetical protein